MRIERRDPVAAAWRLCCRLQPDRQRRGAALFIAGYSGVMAVFAAAMSGLVQTLAH